MVFQFDLLQYMGPLHPEQVCRLPLSFAQNAQNVSRPERGLWLVLAMAVTDEWKEAVIAKSFGVDHCDSAACGRQGVDERLSVRNRAQHL